MYSDIKLEANADSTFGEDSSTAAEYGLKKIGLIRTENGTRQALLLDKTLKSPDLNYSWAQYWQDIENDSSPLECSIFDVSSEELRLLSPRQSLTYFLLRYAGGSLFPKGRKPRDFYLDYCYSETKIIEAIEKIASEESEPELVEDLDYPINPENLDFWQYLFEFYSVDHPLADPDTLDSYLEIIKASNGKITLKDLLLSHTALKIDLLKLTMSVRLVDLQGILNYLPQPLQEEFLIDLDRCLDSNIFQFKLKLYKFQTIAILFHQIIRSGDNVENPFYATSDFASPLEILVPNIETADELIAIKNVVTKVLADFNYFNDEGELFFRFGAMLETAKSLENAAEIAEICDFVKFGTNDLTQEITGLNRGVFDHSKWMKQQGYDRDGSYKSPFDTLIPPVLEKMGDAIPIMFSANPNLDIGICGHQMTDWRSILAVLKIGVKYISVPTTYSDISRAKITAAKYILENNH